MVGGSGRMEEELGGVGDVGNLCSRSSVSGSSSISGGGVKWWWWRWW